MAFPAGGSAAIFFVTVVALLLLVKIFCVVTGYEKKIPEIHLSIEEHKQILIQEESGEEQQFPSTCCAESGFRTTRPSKHQCEHEPPPSPLGNAPTLSAVYAREAPPPKKKNNKKKKQFFQK